LVRELRVRYVNGVSTTSIHVELLRVLAGAAFGPVPAPTLAKSLGTSPQFVVAKLRPLLSAGLVTKHSSRSGRTYEISDEGRTYLRRSR
jgi:predicted transcriptional regulator